VCVIRRRPCTTTLISKMSSHGQSGSRRRQRGLLFFPTSVRIATTQRPCGLAPVRYEPRLPLPPICRECMPTGTLTKQPGVE